MSVTLGLLLRMIDGWLRGEFLPLVLLRPMYASFNVVKHIYYMKQIKIMNHLADTIILGVLVARWNVQQHQCMALLSHICA